MQEYSPYDGTRVPPEIQLEIKRDMLTMLCPSCKKPFCQHEQAMDSLEKFLAWKPTPFSCEAK